MIPPGLERVVARAAARREARGAFGDAVVQLDPLTASEADALDGLPWPGRARRFLVGLAPRIHLVRFEAALEAAGLRPIDVYTASLGRRPRDLPGERQGRRAVRDAFWTRAAGHPVVAARPALTSWLQRARATGRLRPGDEPLLLDALRLVDRLPAVEPVDRAVLAAEVCGGDPHALDADTALERLTRALLAAVAQLDDSARPREVWSAFGVEVDPTSTTVLTLGLAPVGDGPLDEALRALRGRHVVLTYGQLEAIPPTWPASDVFVCENPSVLRAAERALGGGCPALVCGSGWPTDAVRLLLAQLRDAGAQLRYHGDVDATGFAIFRLLEAEVGVSPWRFDVPPQPIDGGHQLPEELVIRDLLADLRTAVDDTGMAGLADRAALVAE